MKRLWPWPENAEDRFEAWMKKQYEAWILTGETSPTGPCPDEAFLRELAYKPKRIRFDDVRVAHAANCPRCLSRLLALRQQRRSQMRRLQASLAGVAVLILIAVLIVVPRWQRRQQTTASAVSVSKTVNLWNAGTYRGQPAPLESVILPATEMRLTIILPRFSQPGRYLVAVTRDQAGSGVIAEGTAASILRGGQTTISVELDLRHARTGTYFLSTTHERNQAAYYYPLQIR